MVEYCKMYTYLNVPQNLLFYFLIRVSEMQIEKEKLKNNLVRVEACVTGIFLEILIYYFQRLLNSDEKILLHNNF